MKYIAVTDIGGTTFRSGIYSDTHHKVDISNKDKIRNYQGKNGVLNAIFNQINDLIRKNNISKSNIIGLGLAVPGPLSSEKGIIFNTPNLKIFRNYKIAQDFTDNLKIKTYIDNDANLFALGEWHSSYKENNVFMGVTIGTGLGFGLIINGHLYKGGNGFGLEYGLSPFEWGECEKNVCIGFIRKRAKEIYSKEMRPVIVEQLYKEGDKNAIKIYHEFGYNLGIVLSHAINMLDPNVISLGGGLSNAYDCFKKPMIETLNLYAPSYKTNNIIIKPSKAKEESTMIGASLMIKNLQ